MIFLCKIWHTAYFSHVLYCKIMNNLKHGENTNTIAIPIYKVLGAIPSLLLHGIYSIQLYFVHKHHEAL